MSDHQHQHQPPSSSTGAGGGPQCGLCPVCALLHAVSVNRPEVTEHLLSAARELTRAVAALLDGSTPADQAEEPRLHRIQVD